MCPAGHPSIEEYELKDAPERVPLCRNMRALPLDPVAQCGPACYVLKADLVKVNIERRRRAEATEEWCKRYDLVSLRAEARPGLGRLRVPVGCGLPST